MEKEDDFMEVDMLPVSVVCYDNIEEVINFGMGLARQSMAEKLMYLVTCNKCKQKKKLREGLDAIQINYRIYEPLNNLGYIHGCLFGLEEFSKSFNYTWALISNTDISFKDKDFFREVFIGQMGEKDWCIAPHIINAVDGVLQNPFMIHRISKYKIILYNIFFSNQYFYAFYVRLSLLKKMKKRKKIARVKNTEQKIYAAHGSCFFLKRDCVDALLENNDNVFMYGEEILIAEIIRENRKNVIYNTSIAVTHYENQITGKINYGIKQMWFKQSMSYLYKRFFRIL